MRVGLIGLGAIGRGVLRLLRPEDMVDLVGALVADPRDNPRTGRLVAMSIVHALRQRHAMLVVG